MEEQEQVQAGVPPAAEEVPEPGGALPGGMAAGPGAERQPDEPMPAGRPGEPGLAGPDGPAQTGPEPAGQPGEALGPGAGDAAGRPGQPGGEDAAGRREQRMLEEQLAGLGLDPAGLFDLLLDSPLLRQTAALAEEALAARAQKRQEEELRGIAALAPELRTPELLAAAPEYPEMQRLLRQNKGMGTLEAFKLAFFDRLTRRQAAAGRQGAINAARAQRHLAGVGGQPPEAEEPSEDLIREYRRYNPRWTVAEIRRFHREYLDETGG